MHPTAGQMQLYEAQQTPKHQKTNSHKNNSLTRGKKWKKENNGLRSIATQKCHFIEQIMDCLLLYCKPSMNRYEKGKEFAKILNFSLIYCFYLTRFVECNRIIKSPVLEYYITIGRWWTTFFSSPIGVFPPISIEFSFLIEKEPLPKPQYSLTQRAREERRIQISMDVFGRCPSWIYTVLQCLFY